MLKLGLCSINSTVGDIQNNKEKIIQKIKQAQGMGIDIIIFPEMCLCGYPPEDLLFKKTFIDDNKTALYQIIESCQKICVMLGFVDKKKNSLFNSMAVIKDSRLKVVYSKIILPNYGVFDEKRYFQNGNKAEVFIIGGIKLGLTICEDMWEIESNALKGLYKLKPDILINISASPYHMLKCHARESLLKNIARTYNLPTVYVNLVGGQDELLFDGGNLVCSKNGEIIFRGEHFKETTSTIVLKKEKENLIIISEQKNAKYLKTEEEVYKALVLGTRDYILKNKFKKILLGVSGGIDSALTAKIAGDAIGSENVNALIMPSRYSSKQTIKDAQIVCKNLGINYHIISIEKIFSTFLKMLHFFFKETQSGIAEENLQARIRGDILMAFSNKFGWLVLSTGNKSELSMGYCTLYGDMAGGFAVIKDVPKTLVYKIVRYLNEKDKKKIIPEGIIKRAPSAELKENQKDEDTLPPYKVLDAILKLYIEDEMSFEEIVKKGYPADVVRPVLHTVDHNEYKRRQGAPGIKITPKAFGKDRRFPIVNRYRD
ncbi:NAD+ synthase [bacterium Unc6]|nr:NAD+ synthase [bacterium Unc6]